MLIDENYTLTSDQHSWTLSWAIPTEEINEATGKVKVSRGQSYHRNLLQALEKYQDLTLKGAKNIEEVLEMLRDLKEYTKKIVDESSN